MLGDGDTSNHTTLTPTAISVGGQTIDFFDNWGHSIAITNANKLYVWGGGFNYKLGTGSTANVGTPTAIDAGNDYQYAAAGKEFSHFLRTDGSLYGVGLNNEAQLGIGNTTSPQTALTAVDLTSIAR